MTLSGPRGVWPASGAHHKTGTIMIESIVQKFQAVNGVRVLSAHHWHRSHNCSLTVPGGPFCDTHWNFYTMNEGIAVMFLCLPSDTRFRFIHMIREPVELAISDYLYHCRSGDTNGMHTGPKILRNMSVQAGVELDSTEILGRTLPEIDSVLRLTDGDPRFMHLGLEDFEDDFNATSRCMLRFLFWPDEQGVERLLATVQAASPAAARQSDRDKRAEGKGKGATHFSDDERKKEVRRIVNVEPHPVFDKVRAYRAPWGYVEARPGVFRRPFPASCLPPDGATAAQAG